MTQNDIKYMIETISADIAEFLTNEFGMSISEALDTLYNSETYAKLIQHDNGLYFQSSRYVFSFLQEELAVGKIA